MNSLIGRKRGLEMGQPALAEMLRAAKRSKTVGTPRCVMHEHQDGCFESESTVFIIQCEYKHVICSACLIWLFWRNTSLKQGGQLHTFVNCPGCEMGISLYGRPFASKSFKIKHDFSNLELPHAQVPM